jgi:WD40 repeat protein
MQVVRFDGGRPYSLDSAFSLLATLSYREIRVFDERYGGEFLPHALQTTQPPPPKLSQTLAHPEQEQPNCIRINKCQGRVIMLAAYNGGIISLWELDGDYDLTDTHPVLPEQPQWTHRVKHPMKLNVNSVSLDPTERYLICGCDSGKGPVFVQIERLSDGAWNVTTVETAAKDDSSKEKEQDGEEDDEDSYGWQPPESVYPVRYNAISSPLPKAYVDQIPESQAKMGRYFARPNQSPPEDTFTTQDSLAVSWCPFSTKYCASVTDQSMCFLWDFEEKKVVSSWSGAHVPYASYWRAQQRPLSSIVFSHVPSIPRTLPFHGTDYVIPRSYWYINFCAVLVFADRVGCVHFYDFRKRKYQIVTRTFFELLVS